MGYLRVGKLLDASHESLRGDYRVSCEELEFIVQTAHTIEGVAGCRMTGGGFGGSAIALVHTATAETAQQVMEKAYLARFGRIPSIFLTRPVAGASTCSVEN